MRELVLHVNSENDDSDNEWLRVFVVDDAGDGHIATIELSLVTQLEPTLALDVMVHRHMLLVSTEQKERAVLHAPPKETPS